jgi:hypothetical protein
VPKQGRALILGRRIWKKLEQVRYKGYDALVMVKRLEHL